MSTTTGNGWTVIGNYGRYQIPEDQPLERIDAFILALVKGHPDVDLLLEARLQISQEIA